MLGGGTGAVAWAEQTIHSGLAALLVAAVPMWMVLFDWMGPARRRPTRRVLAGLARRLRGRRPDRRPDARELRNGGARPRPSP